MSSDWYDPDGNPISDLADLRQFNDRKVVAKTPVHDCEVSTVWLGLDHRYGEGPPLIYETLIFGGPRDGEAERYSTRAEAEEGHRRWVSVLTENGPWCSESFASRRCVLRPHGPERLHRSAGYSGEIVEWRLAEAEVPA